MIDEPSSYLDVKQRLNAAKVIRSLLNPETYAMHYKSLLLFFLKNIILI